MGVARLRGRAREIGGRDAGRREDRFDKWGLRVYNDYSLAAIGGWHGTKCRNDRIDVCTEEALGPPLYVEVGSPKEGGKPPHMGMSQKAVPKTLIPARGRKLIHTADSSAPRA